MDCSLKRPVRPRPNRTMSWTSLCELAELEEGKGKYVQIDGFQLAVFLDRGRVYVIDNTCPHAGGNLAAGFVEDGCAVCPRHFWAFQPFTTSPHTSIVDTLALTA